MDITLVGGECCQLHTWGSFIAQGAMTNSWFKDENDQKISLDKFVEFHLFFGKYLEVLQEIWSFLMDTKLILHKQICTYCSCFFSSRYIQEIPIIKLLDFSRLKDVI